MLKPKKKIQKVFKLVYIKRKHDEKHIDKRTKNLKTKFHPKKNI